MEHTIIRATEYGIHAENKDNTYQLRQLLDRNRNKKSIVLQFEKGEYCFKPYFAYEKLLYIANHHEDTIKRIIFDLSGYEDIMIDGGGSSFIFYADCLPFYVHQGNQIVFKNFTMDYRHPAYSEGRIIKAGPRELQVFINHTKYPHRVEHDRLFFDRDGNRSELWGWLEFDSARKAPAEQVLDLELNQEPEDATVVSREIKEDEVVFERIDGKDFPTKSQAGNLLVLRHHKRTAPGFYVTDSRTVSVEQVSCYHALGIGFMAEHTQDITLDKFHVCINPENQRIFTASADAAHFVYCGGKIEIKNCLFENQLDDAVNIHGIYARIGKIVSENEFLIYLVHDMQKGVVMAGKGDSIAVLESDTLCKVGDAVVVEALFLNGDYQYIRTKEPVPQLKEGQVIENLQWMPDVWIHDNIFRNNRARGLLLTSAGRIRVENNLFQNAGAAILLEGDAGGWFESGAAKDIVIRKNTFDNCSYVADWGKAPIQSTPSVVHESGYPYHSRVQIIENKFIVFDERILYMEHIGKLVFTGNKILKSTRFAQQDGDWAVCFDIGEFICDREVQQE